MENPDLKNSPTDSTLAFSLVIPCYNESRGLPDLISRCRFVVEAGHGEIILVNNGSTDNTQEVLEESVGASGNLRFVQVRTNRGYGHGILAGLAAAQSDVVGWTHADLQTDPADVLRALSVFANSNNRRFVKGRRFGRPLSDRFFTAGMSLFESLLLGRPLNDINAQPTLFHRELMNGWGTPPEDFSLDLFAFVQARRAHFKVSRIPVIFAQRLYGDSSWNVDLKSKWRFIKRTLGYSMKLRSNF
jgi:glycosyltransferase involved in cell wall biosynthesis